MKETEKQPEDDKSKALASYAKYSGIAFQMIAIIGIFIVIGYKIDEARHSEKLLITGIMGVLGVAASLFIVIRSLKK